MSFTVQALRSVFYHKARFAFLSLVITFSTLWTTTHSVVAQCSMLSETFDVAPTLSNTPSDGVWYPDRFRPAAFTNYSLSGSNVLKISIDGINDGLANRPAAYQSTFYNTQGRKINQCGSCVVRMKGSLFIPASWATTHRRSDMWATAYDATSSISFYPIIGFRNVDGSTPNLAYWTDAGWVNLGAPSSYDTWYDLEFEISGANVVYRVNGSVVGTTSGAGSTYFGDIIMQAYNFNDASLGVLQSTDSYDAYWDNLIATGVGGNVVTNLNSGEKFCTIQAAIDAANTTSGHTISVGAGTYYERVVVNKSNLTIQGAGSTTIVSSNSLPGSGVTPTVFKVDNVSGVTLKNMKVVVDQTYDHSAVHTSGTCTGLTINNNVIQSTATGSSSVYSYGRRNAVAINPSISGITGYTPDNTGFAGITVSNNTIQNVGAAFFRAGVQMDLCAGTINNNVITSINHDFISRFANAGAITVSNNTFYGGGVNIGSFNGGAGTITISGNTFDNSIMQPASGALGTGASLRLIYYAEVPSASNSVSVSNNNFIQHRWAVSVEDFKNVSFDNNTFTPKSGSTDYVHVSFNTKIIASTSAGAINMYAVGASLTNNTFNGSGASGGCALAFYNHRSTDAIFGSYVIGTAGNENTFNAGIGTFISLDNSSGASSTWSLFSAYSGVPSTTMAPWSLNIDAQNNKYDVGAGPELPSAMNAARLFSVEDKVQHKVDVGTLGFVRIKAAHVFVTTNSFLSPYNSSAMIQRGIDAANSGDIVNVRAGNYLMQQATNRYVFGTNGPHTFGLFIDKDDLTLRGYDVSDNSVSTAANAAAFITTNSDANFGPDGIFVQANNVAIEGLKIGNNYDNSNALANNKTVEVVGDAFVMNKTWVSTASDEGALYIGCWDAAHTITAYWISQNQFENTLVSINNGAGQTGSRALRVIADNDFIGIATPYLIGFRGWNGASPVQGWIVLPVGGAVVTGNAFNTTNVDKYIVARGNAGGYNNSELDWSEMWTTNSFGNHVVTLVDEPTFDVRSYVDATGYTQTRRLSPRIQENVDIAQSGDVVMLSAGTFGEDVTIPTTLTLHGAGMTLTTVSGPIGGAGSTFTLAASNIVLDRLTITRDGNNPTDWNGALNSAGVSTNAAGPNAEIKNCRFIGNRTAIDVNNVDGTKIHNNIIDNNRTGLIFRNKTDNTSVTENFITNNWTAGVLFLDASGGTNSPVQSALNSTFQTNDISGNWYAQVVDRQSGGSLPAPGSNLKNFECNWFGSTSPTTTTSNSTEPGYAALIPVAFGGSATAPGGQPDIAGPASANIDYIPYLLSGTDGSAANGFQPLANMCAGGVPKLTTSINSVVVNANNDGNADNGSFAVCNTANNILFNTFTDQNGLAHPKLRVYQTFTTTNVTVPFCNNCSATMAAFTGATGSAALINPTIGGTLIMTFQSWIDLDNSGTIGSTEPKSDPIVYTITIDAGPSASAGGSSTICSNSSATVSGASASNGSVQWTHNGAGTLLNATSLTPTYTAVAADAGNVVTLTLTVTSVNSCVPQTATASYTITVESLPTASAGGSQTICVNSTATVSGATATNGTIFWSENGSGSITSGQGTLTPVYTPAPADAGSTITLTLTVTSSNSCAPQFATATYTVVVHALPQASAGGSQYVCVGGTATVSGASASNGTILWTENGAGSISSGATTLSPVYTPAPADAGNTVTLTMTVTSNNNCAPATATATYTIHVKPTFTVSIVQSALPSQCQGMKQLTATVSGSSGSPTFVWSPGGSTSAAITALTNGTYSVTVTDANNCPVTITSVVNVSASNLPLSAYVILAKTQIDLRNSDVNGNIGVRDNNAYAKIHDGSHVSGIVRSDLLNLSGGSTIGSYSNGQSIALPSFPSFSTSSNSDVIVNQGQTVTLNGSNYRDVRIRKNATVIFSAATITVRNFKTEDHVTVTYSQDATFRVTQDVTISESNTVNSTAKRLTMYVAGDVSIDNGTVFTGWLHCHGDIDVDGQSCGPTIMNGQFLADDKITSKKYITWNAGVPCSVGNGLQSRDALIAQDEPTDNDNDVPLDMISGIGVYPNPVLRVASIVLSEVSKEPCTVSIYNQLGAKMYQMYAPANSEVITVDMSGPEYASGTYFVRVELANQILSKAIVVVK